MLFLVILAVALLKAAVLFGAGFLLALAVWLLTKCLGFQIAAWARWTGVAVAVGWLAHALWPELFVFDASRAPSPQLQDGYPHLQFQVERFCNLLALGALGLTGLIISFVKGTFALARRAAQSA